MPAKKQYSQAARVQGILRILGTRQGITIGELTEEFGVTKRTLYRDLKALEEAGYPLLSEAADGTPRPEDQGIEGWENTPLYDIEWEGRNKGVDMELWTKGQGALIEILAR